MEVRFREFNPFNCWIWLRFSHAPGQGERGYIDTVFDSWFFLGKLGGFNAENLQVQDEGVGLPASCRCASLPDAADAICGRGLYLIHSCFDDVRWSSRGNRVQVALRRQSVALRVVQ